jgi:hypothetical protein
MYRSCEEIRQELINEIDSDSRLIAQSFLDWHPRFEEKYLEMIQKNIEIFDIYRRWVLTNQKIWSPNQEEALVLRAAALSRNDDPDFCSGSVSLNKAIAYLVMDIYWPLIHTSICSTIFYRSNIKVDENDVQEMMRSESDFEVAILGALCSSLVCCDKITIGCNNRIIFLHKAVELRSDERSSLKFWALAGSRVDSLQVSSDGTKSLLAIRLCGFLDPSISIHQEKLLKNG